MFGRKKKETQSWELTAQSQELDALRSEMDGEKQSLRQTREDYLQKLQELEEERTALQEEYADLLREADAEAERRREKLDEELLQRKRLTEEQIQKNLKAFQENYSYYLSQLKLLMDVLTNVSVTVSESIVTQEDTQTYFRTAFSAQVDTFLRTQQSSGGSEENGAQGGNL